VRPCGAGTVTLRSFLATFHRPTTKALCFKEVRVKFKEIVYCYVDKTISIPEDMTSLRKSFTGNGFVEKELSQNRWLFKRGAAFALEFDYNSEAIQMQVILEIVDGKLKVSVGNWGFPFEPLMMKKRFQKNLEEIISQISAIGELKHQPDKAKDIAVLAGKKKNMAIKAIAYAALGSLAYVLLIKT